jgi:hypothetical protein
MSSSAEQQPHGGSSSGSNPAAGPNAAAAANIRVYVRVRPLDARELATGASAAAPCLSVVPAASTAAGSATASSSSSSTSTSKLVQLHAKPDARLFAFDEVADERASQADVFERVGRPITEACLAGYNGTIFGQTNAQLRRCSSCTWRLICRGRSIWSL